MTARKTRIIAIFTFIFLTLLVSVGCSEEQKAKESMQKALLKQTEMNQYRSSGHAEIRLPGIPLIMDWNGAASKNPLRAEADVKLSLPGSEKSVELPLIVQDNRLYLRIPALNQKDEYFVLETASPAGSVGTPLAENLKNADQLSRTVYTALIEDLHSGWFRQDPEPVKLEDGTTAQTINVNIDANNAASISAAWNKNMPAVFEALRQFGLITDTQANKMKTDWSGKKLQLEAPGQIAFVVDGEGWIRRQNVNLQCTVSSNIQQSAERYQIILASRYEGINRTPDFHKEIPTRTKPAGDILKMLLHK